MVQFDLLWLSTVGLKATFKKARFKKATFKKARQDTFPLSCFIQLVVQGNWENDALERVFSILKPKLVD